jgi:magnesium chelatase family protein
MSVCIFSAVHEAYAASLIKVEGCFLKGYIGVQLLGNVGEITRNGMERAKTALEEAGIRLPQKKMVISLSPGEARKDGSQFDLAFAVAMALLTKTSQNEDEETQKSPPWLFAGELGLDGSLKPVKGIINYGLQASLGGLRGIVVARENAQELMALVPMLKDKPLHILAFSHLSQVLAWIDAGEEPLAYSPPQPLPRWVSPMNYDDMVLTETTKKIAQMVALGQHNLLLSGTPGCGKSMFIQRLPSLLPPMPPAIHQEALIHHSLIQEKIPPELLSGLPPMRMPHHQASPQAILGSAYQPGELALAHGGLLFLDEFCEFRRDIIEGLREPLETGLVRVARAQHKTTWKAKAILAVAFNNCPCGWYGSKIKKCYCPIPKVLSYLRKLSGPILDRIDIHVNMPEIIDSHGTLLKAGHAPQQTQAMLQGIQVARDFAIARQNRLSLPPNNELKACHLQEASGLSLGDLEKRLSIVIPKGSTNRSLIRTVRVARTLGDLDLKDEVSLDHLSFAWRFQSESAAKERGNYDM